MSGNTVVIVNPAACEGNLGRGWDRFERQLMPGLQEALGEAPRVSFTEVGAGATPVARAALKAGARRIVAVGGDGTFSEVIQGYFEGARALGADVPLALMPAGRGNDFFRTLAAEDFHPGEPRWKRALAVLREGQPRATDLGEIRFFGRGGAPLGERLFLNVMSFAFPGLVASRVHARDGWVGRSALGRTPWIYLLQTFRSLGDYRDLPLRVTVDGKVFYEGPLFSGFILNGIYNGGGVRWSDQARVDDGLFHLVLSEPRGLWATARVLPRMRTGRWADVPGAHLSAGRVIRVELLDSAPVPHPLFEVDGELPEPAGTLGAEITVRPGAIQLYRPR